MKRIILILAVAMLAVSVLLGCTQEKELNKSQNNVQRLFQETKNTVILYTTVQQLPGSKSKDKITLYGEQSDDGMPLSWSLVVNGIEKVKLEHEDGLYGFAEVKFEDLDGDNNKEVLLFRQSSGSAGARGLNIYKISETNWEQIFTLENPVNLTDERYNVKYLGNYYASFEDSVTGLKSTINLDKKSYQGREEMLKGIATWVDPIADYSIVDYDGDNNKEVITIQRVIGVAHVDTLALLKTTYRLNQGKYIAISLALADRNDKPLAEVKL